MAAVAFARRMFGGGAPSTTVPGGIGLTDTSDTLASGTNWPSGGSGFFYVVVDLGNSNEEKILCASTVGNLLTYATGGRGADGTAAAVHLANCTIKVCHVAQDDDEANHMVNILGNAAVGALFVGGGAATAPTVLTVGAAGTYLSSNGTDPAWSNLIDTIYPVGALYFETTGTNPATTFSRGTWSAYGPGCFIVSAGTSDVVYTAGQGYTTSNGHDSGGASDITLTAAQSGVPAHTHPSASANGGFLSDGLDGSGSGYTGAPGGTGANWAKPNTGSNSTASAAASHSNLPPYMVVYCWRRTA